MANKLRGDSLHLMHFSKSSLNDITSFEYNNMLDIDLLGSYYEDIFNADVADELEGMYNLLYPNYDIPSISRFCKKFGRATIAGNLIGSTMPGPNSRTSAAMMAYWSSSSNSLSNIDYGRMQVGIVQFFIHHILKYNESNEERKGLLADLLP